MGLNGDFCFFVKSKLSFRGAFLTLQISLWEKNPTKPDNGDLKGAQKSASKSCFDEECNVLCKHKCPYRLCTVLYALIKCSSPVVQTGTDNGIIFVRFSVSVLPGFPVLCIIL